MSEYIAAEIDYIGPLLSEQIDEDYFEDHYLYAIEEVEEKIRRVYPDVEANDVALPPEEQALVKRADRLLSRAPKRMGSAAVNRLIPFRYAVCNDGKGAPFPQFPIVPWDSVTLRDLRDLSKALEGATDECDMQRFLESRPHSLIQHLGGGHGRWVLPHHRLGSEFVTDFVIAERSSVGMQWYPVELESPKARLFNKNGDPSRTLTHAIRQVQDWRSWLQDNLDYARRLQDQNGLGLIDIHPQSMAFIIVGRAQDQTANDNRRRRQMMYQMGIQIRTFDWLVDNVRSKVRSLYERRRLR